ncbi:MAG: CHAT domain-containing protein [Deltaproteobacteria bacterium]|nr:CHAT domain-containing protein [Deltaproteobacteria bacterium]
MDAAQAEVWNITNSPDISPLAKAVDKLARTLTEAFVRRNVQEQIGRARDAATSLNRPLEICLAFANTDMHAHYSWELLQESNPPHRMLITLPGVFITRRFTFAALPAPIEPGVKKLLIVLGEERGRAECEAVKALWKDEGLEVEVLEFTNEQRLQLALFSKVWDVVHFITHGDRERVFLGVPDGRSRGVILDAHQLGNLMQGNVRTACLLSVCNSGLRTLEPSDVPGALLWRGVAQHIIGAGVPNVIGWSNLAYIGDCLRATPIWHQAYLKGEDPRAATQKARRVLVGVKERSYGWLAHFTA